MHSVGCMYVHRVRSWRCDLNTEEGTRVRVYQRHIEPETIIAASVRTVWELVSTPGWLIGDGEPDHPTPPATPWISTVVPPMMPAAVRAWTAVTPVNIRPEAVSKESDFGFGVMVAASTVTVSA